MQKAPIRNNNLNKKTSSKRNSELTADPFENSKLERAPICNYKGHGRL